MRFFYSTDAQNGFTYLDHILYAANPTQGISPILSVQFIYENRSDIVRAYVAGSKAFLSKRLKEIVTSHNGITISTYKLGYDNSAESFRSRLRDLTLCDGSDNCLPPTTFSYSEGQNGFEPAQQWLSGSPVHSLHTAIITKNLEILMGDGRADTLIPRMPNWNTSYWVSLSTEQVSPIPHSGSLLEQQEDWQLILIMAITKESQM